MQFSFNSNIKFKKLKSLSIVLQNKIYFLSIKFTLNNIYITITNNFGEIVLAGSGGSTVIGSSKRNTNYNLELLLDSLLKKFSNLSKILILQLDFFSLKKKKIIIKILQRFQVKILGIQFHSNKAFNGVRLCKKRRV